MEAVITRIVDITWRLALIVAYRLALAWWFVRRPKGYGAHVAVWHGDSLLVIRNSYKRARSFPAGMLGRGEDRAIAAARELREEVGIDVAPDDLAYWDVIISRHEYREDHAFLFELVLGERPEVTVDRREVVDAEWIPVGQIDIAGLSPIAVEYLTSKDRHEPA